MGRAPQKLPSKAWAKILLGIPGYDPIATAAPGDWFEPTLAQSALDFFPECLRHVEGALVGEPFHLEPWQQAIVANLFGWRRVDSMGREVRRYRECLVYVPRKNGKTPLCAGIALFVLFCDGEGGQQNYIAAGDREQAGMLFRHCKGMVEQEPELQSRCRIYGGTASAGQSKSIVREDRNSFIRVISADAETKHGGNTHLAIIDELHVQPNRDLVDVLTSSTASANRKNPLTIYVTTADFNRPSICNEVYHRACKVRDGTKPDSGMLPVIYEALPTDDWTNPDVWKRSNPNLGVSVSLDYLERECAKAQDLPSYENTFKRLHLNMRTETDVRAIPMDRWDAAGAPDPATWRQQALERLKGQSCAAGLDLGSVSDLTALVLLFGDVDGGFDALPFFWCPRGSARTRSRRDRVPYEDWIAQGFVTPTQGNGTDYGQVRRDIGALADAHGICALAVDRLFQGEQLCQELMGDGLEVEAFGQGFYSMAAPTKRFFELLLEGKIRHGGNPVLRWMASNLSTETDPAGNLKPSKRKSAEKIDGIVSLVMALAMATKRSEEWFVPGMIGD